MYNAWASADIGWPKQWLFPLHWTQMVIALYCTVTTRYLFGSLVTDMVSNVKKMTSLNILMHWSYAETTMKLSGRSTETKLYIINPLDPLFLLRRLKVKYMFHIATGEILENTIPMIFIAKLDTQAEYYIKTNKENTSKCSPLFHTCDLCRHYNHKIRLDSLVMLFKVPAKGHISLEDQLET